MMSNSPVGHNQPGDLPPVGNCHFFDGDEFFGVTWFSHDAASLNLGERSLGPSWKDVKMSALLPRLARLAMGYVIIHPRVGLTRPP